MRFSIVVLALSGSASALPAIAGLSARQSTELATREPASISDDVSTSRVEANTIGGDEEDDVEEKRDLDIFTRQTTKTGAAAAANSGAPHLEAIGDNKVNPTTGLTDSEAAEIVTGLDLKDKKAPGSINAKGQRNPLPGLNADETDAIVKQGQSALKEAGAS
ncbi:hypothetical protein Cob_v012447 [Colletotrichum orbiculare MAFF 240422]|uniref:Uncharacterized protein n=1 Tax=Colletotrichum orbiculare (strain 104-T / ATCC 96160 / CBS 514.97 / LARS 414 / MAFF 240422) TaxID=1213857 RepID=N4VJN2_COLOR|nr:hypothetical protein Cob_v012447 [Colletotrichum orbiculare MAFF 240422]